MTGQDYCQDCTMVKTNLKARVDEMTHDEIQRIRKEMLDRVIYYELLKMGRP